MKKRYKRIYFTQYALVALALAVLLGLVVLGMILLEKIPTEDHFAVPWAAGRVWLLEGESPYAESITRIANSAVSDSSNSSQISEANTFTDLIFNLLFYLPFSLIPFKLSRAIWFALSAITIALLAYYSLKISGWKVALPGKIFIITLVILWFPGVKAMMTGRLTPLIILLIFISFDAMLRSKDTLAGFLLSLTFGSLSISALIVLFLLVWCISRQRWAIIKSYFAGLAFLWAISLLLLPSWPKDWLRVVLPLFGNWDWIQTPLMDLSMILPGISYPLSLTLHAVFAIGLITLFFTTFRKIGLEFTWRVLIFFVLVFFFHIQSSVFSLFLVLPALFLVLRFWSERWRILGRSMSWVLLSGLTIATWLYARPGFSFVADERFPILVAGLPVAVLAGLLGVRWWALRLPRLPYEQR